MRHTIIIALLLITLFPNTALAQWGFDAVSVEAYINCLLYTSDAADE